jgi:nucleotidyltransferase substrate binding protein (TIGR01987 family)
MIINVDCDNKDNLGLRWRIFVAKLKLTYESLTSAVKALDDSIRLFEKIKNSKNKNSQIFANLGITYEDMCCATKDSIIKRFKLTIELFWKYLKEYLLTKGIIANTDSPKDVIRSGCKAKLISEEDTETFFEMLKSRNLTSHIYKEELAEKLTLVINSFCEVLKRNINALKPE